MTNDTTTEPTLSPKLLTEDDDFLVRAVEKWMKFQIGMWEQVNSKLEKEIKISNVSAIVFRVVIILLSATVTTVSDIDDIPRTLVTVIAGSLTALTAIEAFMGFSERRSEYKKQQREIEALRDKLRFSWFVQVEVEGEMNKRLAAAKKLLEYGPREYNEMLTKYALKSENSAKPEANA